MRLNYKSVILKESKFFVYHKGPVHQWYKDLRHLEA